MTTVTTVAGRPGTADGRGTPTAAVFAVTALGGLLVSLDVSVANSLLPAIGRDFAGDGRAALSWVITAYAIVFAAALVPAGRIADRAGRRRTFVGGLALFGLGSLVCGVSPDLGVLLSGRVVQGLGAAAASPASLGLLLACCDTRHRATYAARWTGAAAVGVCLGPFVGGVLTEAGDWRWAFLVNLPVVLALAVVAPRVLPESERHPGRRLPDPLGALLLALAAALAALGLSEATTWGATSVRTTGCLAAAGLLTAAFARRSRVVAEPLLQLDLLRNRRVVAAAVVTACYAAGFFGFLVTFMLFAVEQWRLGLVEAGAVVLPIGLVVVVLTAYVGRLAAHVGHRLPLTLGATLMATTLLLMALSLGGDHVQARWYALAPVLGTGIGLCYPVLAGAAVHGLAAVDLAAATAINQCARQLGAAVGVAATVGVLGPDPRPDLAPFHTVWTVAALFCIAAAAAAALIPGTVTTATPLRTPSSSVDPITHPEERSA